MVVRSASSPQTEHIYTISYEPAVVHVAGTKFSCVPSVSFVWPRALITVCSRPISALHTVQYVAIS